MKQVLNKVAVLILGIGCWLSISQALAFSPYEAWLANDKTGHVGLIAAAKPGKVVDLDKALECLTCKKCTGALKHEGITNLCVQKKVLTDQKTWYWAYFDYKGKDYLKAVNAFEKAAPGLAEFIEPHPRAKTYGTAWLQMEWINHLPAVYNDKRSTQKKVAVVTRIKPEKEEQYRTLHQTVWPGVSDQIARSNNRNLSIYLVELGDEIYEFLYLEYVGKDADADDKSSKSDPCTLRWWKLTDACQLPLPDVKEGIWSGMDTVVK